MAAINGSTMLLLLNGVAIAAAKSSSIHWDRNLFPTTSKSSTGGWATHGQGEGSWGGSCDAWHDPSGVTSTEQIFDMLGARTATSILEIATVDGTGGGELYKGTISIDHLELVTDMEAAVAVSFSFVGNGVPAKGTVVSS